MREAELSINLNRTEIMVIEVTRNLFTYSNYTYDC